METDRGKPLKDRCPGPEILRRYAMKELIGPRNEEVHLHVQRCEACLSALAELTRVPSPEEIIRRGGGAGRVKRRRR